MDTPFLEAHVIKIIQLQRITIVMADGLSLDQLAIHPMPPHAIPITHALLEDP